MPANVALKIRCAGPGPGHDDRDHREAMVLSEGHIQCGLTVIPFSAAAADAVGITDLNARVIFSRTRASSPACRSSDVPFCEGENVIPLPAVEVPTRISPRELKVRITEGCTHQFTGNSLTLCFALSRRGHGMRCLRQRSYRCGCPDGNRHAHVVHCHARTSHNRRCPYRHPGKSLPGILQLWLQHQVVSDTEGQTGFQ